MPLYGRKIFHIQPPLTDLRPEEKIFTIDYTGEQFRSESEYEKRLSLYKEKSWTCQCTGHINLTHEQAWKSEQEKMDLLRKQYPEYFEKPVLEIVHHNTTILDNLVDQTWTRLQQVLAVGEPVVLKMKSGGQEMPGKITKIEPCNIEAVNGTSDGECNSPSSDKENKTNGEDADSSFKDSPSKWHPPRLLPLKYTLSLDNSDQVIVGIPASDIKRLKRTPSKELVKLFIRSNAHRPGLSQASPWVVNEEMVKKYSLHAKFADIFMSPNKMGPSSKKPTEAGKKRKASLTPTGPSKKPKLDSKTKLTKSASVSVLKANTSSNALKKSASPKKAVTPKKGATPKKGTPSKVKAPPKVVQIDSSSDSSDSEEESIDSSIEDNMPLSDIKEGKSPMSSPKKGKSLADIKKEMAEKEKTKKNQGKGSKSQMKKTKTADSGKKRAVSGAVGSSQGKKAKTSTPKKKLKQMTLFDMKGKKKSGLDSKAGTPKKSSPKKQTPVKLPPIVTKLQKAMKRENKTLIGQLVAQCAKILNARQRAALPDTVKESVMAKFERIAEKKKLEAMTPKEKEEYLRQKRKEAAKKHQEKRLEQNKRFEDSELKLAPLPTPKLVATPDGLPNELFGEIVMVTQFVSCYRQLLLPDDTEPIMTDELMRALVSDKAGFACLSRALQVLLQTLLQDGVAEEYKELSVALKSVTVTRWNVSELVRLCLRRHDVDDVVSNDSEDDAREEEEEVPEELIEQLETDELYSLRPGQKLQILSSLCARIMNSYSAQDFMEEKQREATELWKAKVKQQKENNDQKKEAKLKKKADRKQESAKKADDKNSKNMKNMTITSFYGASGAEAADSGASDITSVLKSRRLAAARAAEERARQHREEMFRRHQETAEMRAQRDKETLDKRYAEGIVLAKEVCRHAPLGTDRNHDRYWVFHETTPGLFIEKGWAPKEIGYSVKADVSNSETNSKNSSPKKKKGRPQASDVETTFPHTGQNLWFTYDSAKDVDLLLQNLHPLGIRESALVCKLNETFPDTSKAIFQPKREVNETSESDGDMDLKEGFRNELLAMETSLRNGGLGGVDKYPDWEKRLKSANSLDEFGELLIECQEFISEKFRSGILAPIKQKVKVETKTEDRKEPDEADDEEEQFVEETILKHDKVLKLQEAIRECPTFARLHFLMGIVDSSIKWEKSAENAKCKICRKKGHDLYVLLCDDCNQPFHMYCLRPALPEIPEGDWFCPSCRPLTQRRCRREVTNYKKLDRGTPVDSSDEEDSSSDGSSDVELVRETQCAMCGGDEELVPCSTCVSVFHMMCHDPPLTREPRAGTWKCMQCRSGVRLTTRRRRAAAENRKRWTRQELDSESETEEEEEEQEESEEEEEENDEEDESEGTRRPATRPTRTSVRRSSSNSRPTRSRRSEDASWDSDTAAAGRPAGRRSSTRRRDQDAVDQKQQEMKAVMEILNRVMKNKKSYDFHYPVDVNYVPDYYDVISNPIDLTAMKEKCEDDVYTSAQQFVDDMALLFDNGDMYNKPDSDVGKCIPDLEKLFKNLLSRLLPDCTYERKYNRAEMAAETALDYSDHTYC